MPKHGIGGPLAGIRVIDTTINVVGPLSCQLLGDMGADVIKIETPEGDPNRITGPTRNPKMAALFLNMNRNKRSVVLNLKSKQGMEALLRLIDTADVFVHSMRQQAAERLGIGYKSLSERNPRLIYAFGPGYRTDGPNKNRPAYDDVIQGHSGVAGMIGRANGEPRYMPSALADKICAYLLASSVSMALYAREKIGRGQEVQVPMMENMVSFLLWEHLWSGSFDPAMGKVGYARMFTPHRRPYKTLDGFICLMVINDDQWRRLLTTLGRPELPSDPRFSTLDQRTINIDELYGIVAEEISKRTTADWQERLDAADIPNGPMNHIEGLFQDPYLVKTGFFERYDHPTEGSLVRTPITVQYSETPGSIRIPVPTLGQHSREVLTEIGYTDADIADLAKTTPS